MQMHIVKRNIPRKRKISVGRGGKRGKISGRGTKGQNARAGRKKRPELRDLIKKLPKLRGRGVHGGKGFREKSFPINIGLIESHFAAGGEVTPGALIEKGLAKTSGGAIPVIKILGAGLLTKSVIVKKCLVSKSAKVKIEKAGGKVEYA